MANTSHEQIVINRISVLRIWPTTTNKKAAKIRPIILIYPGQTTHAMIRHSDGAAMVQVQQEGSTDTYLGILDKEDYTVL